MKLTSVEKKEKSQVQLTVVVDKETFEAACQKSYRKNVASINIQGFRKGKAPRKMIEKLYGPEIFYDDAMNECIPEAYEAALAESKLEPVGQPTLGTCDVQDGEFIFTVLVPVTPEVTLKAYKGLEAEKETVRVYAKEVDEEIEKLRSRNARQVTVDRAVENGDEILLDFEGFVDGVAFEGGKGENFSLKIGSGSFIPGFEEQLIGKKAGEACEVNVSFPADYHAEELAGKPAVFKCTVNEVKVEEKPALDDEFVKDVSEFDTVDELKADLKKKLQESKAQNADNAFMDKIMEQLVEGMEADIPDAMIEARLDSIVEDFGYRIAMQGMDLESYLKMSGMEMRQFRGMFLPQAEKQVKVRLALETVAKLEGIEVSDEDCTKEFEELAKNNNLTIERVQELLPMETLKKDLLVQKAQELVKDSAVVAKKKKAAKKEDAESAE